MATTEISISNIALSLLGANLITDFPPGETSKEAALCSSNFVDARDATLEDRDWTFASDRATLTPLASSPDHGYAYQFQLPSDCIRVIFVSQSPFEVQPKDDLKWSREGDKILTDVSRVYIKYVCRVTNPQKFSSGFKLACGYKLASMIAIALTGSKDMQEIAEAKYQQAIDTSGTMDGMQGSNIEVKVRKLTEVRQGLSFNIFDNP